VESWKNLDNVIGVRRNRGRGIHRWHQRRFWRAGLEGRLHRASRNHGSFELT